MQKPTALFLAFLLCAAAPPPVPVYKQFGDWLAVCDNIRGCELKALPDDVSDAASAANGYTMSVLRAAGPGAMPRLAVGGEEAAGRAVATLDGKAFTNFAVGQNGNVALAGTDALGVVRSLRDGTALTLAFSGGTARISLRGFAAALLFCDAVQGRVDTADALARPGLAPAASVPPAPPLPVLRGVPAAGSAIPKRLTGDVRRAVAAVLKAHDCDLSVARDGDTVAPLDAGSALVLLTCDTAAYQSDFLAFRVPHGDAAHAELLRLPLPAGLPPDLPPTTAMLTEASFDPAKALLQSFYKGRGPADCGESASWVYDGTSFRIAGYSLQRSCAGEPGNFPVLFRSRTILLK